MWDAELGQHQTTSQSSSASLHSERNLEVDVCELNRARTFTFESS